MQSFPGLIYGIVYGVAHVVPGVSGGTFLVIFGCYDTVCEAFALNFTVIKKHFLFFLLFGIGTVGGLVGFVHAITYLLNSFALQTNLFFMGLIIGGLPLIITIATKEEKFRPVCIVPFILGLAVVVALFLIEKTGALEVGAAQASGFLFSARIFLYSFIAAIAMIMPGISGAFVLVAFGIYDMFMEAITELDFAILVPAVIGIFFGIIAGARLILLILKKHKLIVYSAIIGMVIGSVAPLYPDGIGLNIATLAGVVCLSLGVSVAYIMGKKESKANEG